MKALTLFVALALPALAADTTIVGTVVGVHDGDTLTLRTEDETLKVPPALIKRMAAAFIRCRHSFVAEADAEGIVFLVAVLLWQVNIRV